MALLILQVISAAISSITLNLHPLVIDLVEVVVSANTLATVCTSLTVSHLSRCVSSVVHIITNSTNELILGVRNRVTRLATIVTANRRQDDRTNKGELCEMRFIKNNPAHVYLQATITGYEQGQSQILTNTHAFEMIGEYTIVLKY